MFHLIAELEGNDYIYINMSYSLSALHPYDSLFCVKNIHTTDNPPWLKILSSTHAQYYTKLD